MLSNKYRRCELLASILKRLLLSGVYVRYWPPGLVMGAQDSVTPMGADFPLFPGKLKCSR